jgi:hypothetical protein
MVDGGMTDTKRWWCVEATLSGRRIFIGRVEATEAEIRDQLGEHATLNRVNGEAHVWMKPPAG